LVSGADIEGAYRYSLTRYWAEPPFVAFVMLNPSTADASQDDPTIRRCIGYAQDWGYGGLHVVNLFALRATDPKELLKHPDPVGPRNVTALLTLPSQVEKVVCGWGAMSGGLKRLRPHAQTTMARLVAKYNRIFMLRLTKDGFPSHPLYLPKNLQPTVVAETL
jgi:hypothetical protein